MLVSRVVSALGTSPSASQPRIVEHPVECMPPLLLLVHLACTPLGYWCRMFVHVCVEGVIRPKIR